MVTAVEPAAPAPDPVIAAHALKVIVRGAALGALIVFALIVGICLANGLTPDRPDPAGTVNRVVQGVTIHPWNGAGGHVPRR